ncbi:MAG: zf-HC2 domain-containing protein [Candidatus Saccharicenans sp.]|nr:zf-HC2 domain-containing protein [Candidatus Saccharicenans sp.]
MRCKDYQKLISDRLDGCLSPVYQERLEAHLKTCPVCGQYEKELKTIDREIRNLPVEELENLAGLESGLRERLSRVETENGIKQRGGRFIKWTPAWASGLLLLMIAVYFVFFRPAAVEQNLDLATLMSFEDSYLTLTQTLNNDESLKEKYNEEILNSIFEEVEDLSVEKEGGDEYYREQIINNNNEITLLPENMGFSEGK